MVTNKRRFYVPRQFRLLASIMGFLSLQGIASARDKQMKFQSFQPFKKFKSIAGNSRFILQQDKKRIV